MVKKLIDGVYFLGVRRVPHAGDGEKLRLLPREQSLEEVVRPVAPFVADDHIFIAVGLEHAKMLGRISHHPGVVVAEGKPGA